MQTIRIGGLEISTGVEREREFRLRHAVYCEEYGYLPRRADGLESDPYDVSSIGVTLVDARSGATAGCLRLVLAGTAPLPVELMHRSDGQPEEFRRDPFWAEVSRVTVAREFRWGASGADAAYPVVLMGVLAAHALCRAVGVRRAYTLSEVPMARMMRRIGIDMEQVGGVVDYHGSRAPFRIDVNGDLNRLPAGWRADYARLVDWAHGSRRLLRPAA